MYVVAASENLIETLRLIVQNDRTQPLFLAATETAGAGIDPADVEVFEASAVLADEFSACCAAGERQWLVLVAKEWENAVLNTIADVARLNISQSGTCASTARIMIVKKEPCSGDFELLRDHLSVVRECWREEWLSAFEKYSRLGESAARTEHLTKVERWAQPAQLDFQLVYMDDSELLRKIRDFAAIPASHEFVIMDTPTGVETPNCFTKPPALHWTNYPREADVQLSFKFTFPIGTVTDSLFRAWSATVRGSYQWEYTYEWTNGVFLRQNLIKLTLVRGPSNIIEITGRIDKDEANEEDEEDEEERQKARNNNDNNNNKNADDETRKMSDGASCQHWGEPLHRVWPYFAKAFECLLTSIDSIQTMPYTLNLVFIGQIFFDSPTEARQVVSRSLDAVQTFGAIQRAKAVRFKVQDDPDHVYAVRLEQAFPGFTPTRLADVCAAFVGEAPPPAPDQTPACSPLNSAVDFKLRSGSAESSLADESAERDAKLYDNANSPSPLSPSRFNGAAIHFGSPTSATALLDRSRQSSNCLLTDRQPSVHKNRGRRVSFGAIRAIPSQDLCAVSTSTTSTSPLLVRMSGSSNRLVLQPTSASTKTHEIAEEHKVAGVTVANNSRQKLTTELADAYDDEKNQKRGGTTASADEEPHDDVGNDDTEDEEHVQNSDVINEYVEKMLKNAINEVLIQE